MIRALITALTLGILLFLTVPARAASLADFGAVGNGQTDTASAWGQAVAAVCASPTERTLA